LKEAGATSEFCRTEQREAERSAAATGW